MATLVLLLLALVAAATEGQSREGHYGDYYDDANYEYHYRALDDYGNSYGKQETRHGRRTDGSFYVSLPDGRMQKVYYFVDGDSGFVADVKYDGEALDDSYESSRDSYEYRR